METLEMYSATDLLKMNTPVETWLWDQIIPKRGIACLAGGTDVGKSTLARQICTEIVLGRESFLNQKLSTNRRSALYFSTEDSIEAQREFLLRHASGKADELSQLKFFKTDVSILNQMAIALDRFPSDIVVLDAWTDTFIGFINQANSVRQHLHLFQTLAERHNTVIVLLHHIGKGKEIYGPSKHNLIGSQAIEAKCRAVVEMSLRDEFRYLTVTKGNYTNSFKSNSIEMKFDSKKMCFSYSKLVENEKVFAMPKGKLNSEMKELILALHLQNHSIREIANIISKHYEISIGKSSVGEVVKSSKAA